MAKLVQNAVSEVYLKPKQKRAGDLWGIVKNSRLKDSDFEKLKQLSSPKL